MNYDWVKYNENVFFVSLLFFAAFKPFCKRQVDAYWKDKKLQVNLEYDFWAEYILLNTTINNTFVWKYEYITCSQTIENISKCQNKTTQFIIAFNC